MQSRGEKLVSDYTRLSFLELEELFYEDYLRLLRDAVIYGHSRTEEGRKYLADCWRFEQTEPDVEALREKYGEG